MEIGLGEDDWLGKGTEPDEVAVDGPDETLLLLRCGGADWICVFDPDIDDLEGSVTIGEVGVVGLDVCSSITSKPFDSSEGRTVALEAGLIV